ncbi:tetratricopeptide repeat protein [Streptomyces polygonati]|uniref:Tetratricopeptide repeat protein n=1 Tax=Streptomyces polygonati TaxID=1617087 RepID=A0ABV8HWV6_9ACTN
MVDIPVDVFVNYRTLDARYGAAACYELLAEAFGAERVFRDCVTMLPGEVYPAAIRLGLEQSRVLLVLIGPDWLAADPAATDGGRLVDRESDWVRREIRRALARGIAIVPVLLDGAAPPVASELPADIAELAYRQASFIDHRTLGEDVRRLAGLITELVPELLLPDLFEAPQELPADPLPSMLLRAEYGVVEFVRDDDQLPTLVRWLESADRFGVRLLTGPGGQGKTRIAGRLIEEAAAGGWAAGFVPEEVPARVLARVHRLSAPLLLVVDYAEGRTAQLAALAAELAARSTGPEQGPVRMLLLARSAGVWQQFLRRSANDRVATAFMDMAEQPLPSVVPAPDRRRAEYDRALAAFAARLGRPAAQASPPPADLAARRYDRVLDIHAAALAALLDGSGGGPGGGPGGSSGGGPGSGPGPGPGPGEGPANGLGNTPRPTTPARRDPILRVLDHERRYWTATAPAFGLPDPHPGRLDQAVTAATLFGARDTAGAHALLAALPTFDRQGHDTVDRYRRWLGALYPGTAAALNPIRPDRLGEDLVVATLLDHPELCAAVAGPLDGLQITRALTVLGRAAARRAGVEDAMRALITADPLARLPIAIAVATRTEDDTLVGVLTEVTAGGADLGLQEAMVEHLPEESLALAVYAVVSTRAALAALLAGERAEGAEGSAGSAGAEGEKEEPDDAAVAQLKHNLALRLEAVGEFDDALVQASGAVERFDRLAADDPDFADDLGNALNTLAGAYSHLGFVEEGLEQAVRAVELLRERAESSAEARAFLPTALTSYGNLLGDCARHQEAVAAIEEAVRRQRAALAEAADDQEQVESLYRLAGGLDNLANALSGAHRHTEGLAASIEGARAYRELDAASSDRFRGELIRALGNLSGAYAELARWAEAYEVTEEAVRMARELVARHGDVHLTRLADTLNNSAAVLRNIAREEGAGGDGDDGEEAVKRITEAVSIYRRLATALPGTQLSGLAGALHNLGNALSGTDRPVAALDAYDESVDIYRKLSDPRPDVFEPDLADALVSMADLLHDEGDSEEALRLAGEAAAILQRLVDGGRAELDRKLGSALHLLGLVLFDLGRYGEAARAQRRAARCYAQLAERAGAGVGDGAHDGLERADFAAQRASVLHGLARTLDVDGRLDEADAAFTAAARQLYDLAEAGGNPGEYDEELSAILHNHAVCLSALDRGTEAVVLVTEAARIRRSLADDERPATQVELAESLNNLADTLHDLGCREEAVAQAREAVEVCARLYAEGHAGTARLSVYALATLTTALGREDIAAARAALERARQIAEASADEDLAEVVGDAMAQLTDGT